MIHWTPQVEQAVFDNDFAVPDGAELAGMVDDLLDWLGSEAPHERDDVAYSVLATWTERGVLDDRLERLGERAAADLQAPEVQRRTFATLMLAEVVGRDAAVRVVPEPHLHSRMDRWTAWYLNETDLRSWDPQLGWLHAVGRHVRGLRAAPGAEPW